MSPILVPEKHARWETIWDVKLEGVTPGRHGIRGVEGDDNSHDVMLRDFGLLRSVIFGTTATAG